jgi:hypothetical protein
MRRMTTRLHATNLTMPTSPSPGRTAMGDASRMNGLAGCDDTDVPISAMECIFGLDWTGAQIEPRVMPVVIVAALSNDDRHAMFRRTALDRFGVTGSTACAVCGSPLRPRRHRLRRFDLSQKPGGAVCCAAISHLR